MRDWIVGDHPYPADFRELKVAPGSWLPGALVAGMGGS